MSERPKPTISRQLNRADFSDLKIRCNGREWLVHKLVLCTQSVYFDRVVRSGMKEAHESIIELHEDDSTIVELMLVWLYNGDWDTELRRLSKNHATTRLRLDELADKYLLHALKTVILAGLRNCNGPNNAKEVVAFAKVADYVYSMKQEVGQPLRDIVLLHVVTHRGKLFDTTNKETAMFREALRTIPVEFAADVAERLAAVAS